MVPPTIRCVRVWVCVCVGVYVCDMHGILFSLSSGISIEIMCSVRFTKCLIRTTVKDTVVLVCWGTKAEEVPLLGLYQR